MNDNNDIIEFADARLDLRRAVLERNGVIVQVRPRTFAVLCYVAGNPDRVIGKDEILAAVWQRSAVSDDALTQTIKDVRRVIGDHDGTILRTIPKRGFLFTDEGTKGTINAHVLEVDEPTEAKPAPETKPPELKRRFSSAPMIVVIVLAVIAAGAWRFFGANSISPSDPTHLSIVVLPFKNLSDDPGQVYFADGVTDYLTTDLARIRDSFVIASATAFTYRGKTADAREIGKQLGVRYVLEGSVQRDRNRMRVNAQLIDAQSGAQLWADRFEDDVADLFKLQDQVVARLANTLGLELVKAEAERGVRSNNPDTFDFTMRGWALVRQAQFTKEANKAARDLFEQALKIDASNAEALTGEAYTYAIEYIIWRNQETDYDTKILSLTKQSIAIAPDFVWAYVVKGVFLQYTRRAANAVDAADAGLAINSNFVHLWSMRGDANVFLGRFEQARSDILQALKISPRDPRGGTWTKYLGDAEFGLGHFDAAIQDYHRAIELGGAVAVYPSLAAASALAGNMDEAKVALGEARRLEPKFTVKWMTPQPWVPPIPNFFDGLRKAGLAEE